jgi:hypothetical protein
MVIVFTDLYPLPLYFPLFAHPYPSLKPQIQALFKTWWAPQVAHQVIK